MRIPTLIQFYRSGQNTALKRLFPKYLTFCRLSIERSGRQYIEACAFNSSEANLTSHINYKLIELYKRLGDKIAIAQEHYPYMSTNGQFVMEKALQLKRFKALSTEELKAYIQELHKAISLGLNNDLLERAHLELAQSQSMLQNYDIAISHIDQALLLNPNSSHYWFLRASANGELNNLESALQDYGMALSIIPSDFLIVSLMGKIKLKLRRTEEAIQDFDVVISSGDKSALLQRGIAKSLPEVDDTIGSISDLEQFIQHVEANPNNFPFGASAAYLQLGRIYHSMGVYNQAKNCYWKVLDIKEKPEIKVLLADVNKARGLVALAAIEAIESTQNGESKNTTIQQLKEAFRMMNNTQDALGSLERALSPEQKKMLQDLMFDIQIVGYGTEELNNLVLNKILLNQYI